MRSYGLTRAELRQSFMLQGLIIGTVGATIGLFIAKGIVWTIRQFKFPVEGLVKSQGILMAERPHDYLIAFLSALLITLIAAYLPANRAAKFNPVEILRGRH